MIAQEFLSKIPIFQELSAPDLAMLTPLWHQKSVKQKEVLFRKGDASASMFIIEKGSIEITIPAGREQKEVRVSVLNEGDFLGELSLVDGSPRTATATALDDGTLLEMNREDLIGFLISRPTVAISMISEMGKRLHATNELVSSLTAKNINVEMDERLGVGDHIADKVADFVGSWKFLACCVVGVGIWCLVNAVEILYRPFDPYPFVFLNLILGFAAAVQAPLILMSQNRAQIKDRLRAESDYEVNVKSELMLRELHAKLDEIRTSELQMVREILQKELVFIHEEMKAINERAGSPHLSSPRESHE